MHSKINIRRSSHIKAFCLIIELIAFSWWWAETLLEGRRERVSFEARSHLVALNSGSSCLQPREGCHYRHGWPQYPPPPPASQWHSHPHSQHCPGLIVLSHLMVWQRSVSALTCSTRKDFCPSQYSRCGLCLGYLTEYLPWTTLLFLRGILLSNCHYCPCFIDVIYLLRLSNLFCSSGSCGLVSDLQVLP